MNIPNGPVKYVIIRDSAVKNRGIEYLMESRAIQDPTNKLIDKKCSQKIKRKASFEKSV